MSAVATRTVGILYRCPQCKVARRVEHPMRWKPDAFYSYGKPEGGWRYVVYGGRLRDRPETIECPNGCRSRWQDAPQYLPGQKINGRVTDKKCGARCVNAVGPSCECQCGGKNHGSGHA